MSKLLYDLFLGLYGLGIRIAACWNPKAKAWLSGRKDIFSKIDNELSETTDKHHLKGAHSSSGRTIWMHCASLGEFEQGRPLLENLRKEYPGYRLILSFFSPSGYEVIRDYTGADHIFYLPADSKSSAIRFIDAIDPNTIDLGGF